MRCHQTSGNPLASPYSASKHAIEGLSESLRREMMLFGIDVIMVAPGAVKTPIWGKADEFSGNTNSPYAPALEKIRAFTQHLSEIGLPPEKVADAARTLSMRVEIADGIAAALCSIARLAYEVPPRILIAGSLYLAGHVLAINGTPPG